MPRGKPKRTSSRSKQQKVNQSNIVIDLDSDVFVNHVETAPILQLVLPEDVAQIFHDIQFRGNFMDIVKYDMSGGEYTFGIKIENFDTPLNMLDFAVFHGANEIAVYLIEQRKLKPTQQTLEIVDAKVNPNQVLQDLVKYFLQHGEVPPLDLPAPSEEIQPITSAFATSSMPVNASVSSSKAAEPRVSTPSLKEAELLSNLDELLMSFPNPARAIECGDLGMLQRYFEKNSTSVPTYWDSFLQRRLNLLERALTEYVNNSHIVDYLVQVQGYQLQPHMLGDAIFYAHTWAIEKLLQYPDFAEYASHDNNALLKQVRASGYSNAEEMAALLLALPNVAAVEAAEQQVTQQPQSSVHQDPSKKRGREQTNHNGEKYRRTHEYTEEEIVLPPQAFAPMMQALDQTQKGQTILLMQPQAPTSTFSSSDDERSDPKDAEQSGSNSICLIM